jgi:hypothetical protein
MKLACGLLVILLSLCLPFGVSAQDSCTVGGAELASCSANARVFESVLIAIPGWTGVCKTSFGENERNLLNAIREVSFFDVDCFDYDSHGPTFEEIRDQLWARIQDLHAKGYKEFALVTHSTGGIVASFLIQTQLFPNGGSAIATGADRGAMFRADGPRLRGLYTWAVPLNGLNPLSEAFAIVSGISPTLLPNMRPNAVFLKLVQERWQAFAEGRDALPVEDRNSYRFPWLILQGQDLDGVVNPVVDTDEWFPTEVVKLLNTEVFHTDVVSDAGTKDVPKYPGEVMTTELLLSLPFRPRYTELFSPATPNDDVTKAKQRAVLAAVIGLADFYNGFPAVRTHVTDFVVRLFRRDYPHDSAFDQDAVRELAGLLDETITVQGDAVVVEFGDDLISAIHRAFPPDYVTTDQVSFGGGSYEAVRDLAAAVGRVHQRVVELTDGDPALVSSLRSSGSREEFDRRYLEVSQRFLLVQDDPTREATVAALQISVPSVEPQLLLDSGVVESLAQYARIAPAQPQLGELFLQLQERSPELNVLVLEQSLPQLELPMGDTSLWNSVFTDEQAVRLLENAERVGGAEEQRARLLNEMIVRGSVSGGNAGLGAEALTRYEVLLAPGVEGRNEWAERLSLGLEETNFPMLERRGIDVLQDNGFSR